MTTGRPFTVTLQTGVNNGAPSWPNRIGSGRLDNPTVDLWFNPPTSSRRRPTPTATRAAASSTRPGHANFDTSLSKRFSIGGRANAEFRWDVFNLFNHPGFGFPNAAIGNRHGRPHHDDDRGQPQHAVCAEGQFLITRWLKVLHRFTLALLTAASSLVAAPAAAQQASGRPNVVVILVDDMGWSDIGRYGGEIATPHLDALAANGVRFTQFYSTPRCSPSRASLLTGLYPHQAGMGHLDNVIREGSSGTTGRLNDRSRDHRRSAAGGRLLHRRWRASGTSASRMARRPGSAVSIAS